MTRPEIGETDPHQAPEPEGSLRAQFPVPAPDQALRGAAFALLAIGLASVAWSLARRAGLLALPLFGAVGAGALLSAWAAVIHLTGGERFDDHPFL